MGGGRAWADPGWSIGGKVAYGQASSSRPGAPHLDEKIYHVGSKSYHGDADTRSLGEGRQEATIQKAPSTFQGMPKPFQGAPRVNGGRERTPFPLGPAEGDGHFRERAKLYLQCILKLFHDNN